MLPIVIGAIVLGTLGVTYVYERFIDSDPAPIQNYNIYPPPALNGGTYTPTQYGGDQPGGGGDGMLAGLGTAGLLAVAAGGYLLLKD